MLRKTTLALLLIILTSCGTTRRPDGLPGNFGVVEEGKIYRGAQPDDTSIAALQKLGIRTIVKLNDAHFAEESAAALRAGITLISVPLDPHTVGTARSCPDVERAYAALTSPAHWPVYVHCTHGRDRTGYLIGLIRERREGWAYERVSQELEQYGHNDVMRMLMPNITSSLAHGPACPAN
ncbi:MAG: tyrosine-protein phosphatase [Acidobacteriota bacterium]